MNKDFIIEDGMLKSYIGNEKEVIIPNEVKSIGYRAFYKNLNINKIIMPNTVEEISCSAFSGCNNLEKVILSKELKKVAINSTVRNDGIFIECRKLKSVGPIGSDCNIEYNWENTIPNSAFYGSEIENAIVSEKINKIENYAFYGTCVGKILNISLPINCILEKKSLDKDNVRITFCQNIKTENKISSEYLSYDDGITQRLNNEELSWILWFQSRKWKDVVINTIKKEDVLDVLNTIYYIGRIQKKITKTNVQYILKIINKIKDTNYYQYENQKLHCFLNEINYKDI